MAKDFTGTTKTKTGIDCKDVRFNTAVNKYLGMVWDESAYRPDKWTSCTWTKSGKCVNRNCPQFDL